MFKEVKNMSRKNKNRKNKGNTSLLVKIFIIVVSILMLVPLLSSLIVQFF